MIGGGRTHLYLALQLSILLPQGSCLSSSLLTCLQQGTQVSIVDPVWHFDGIEMHLSERHC